MLGLSPRASADDVRRQYKRLAKQFHPDLNADPAAGLRMKALNEAYRVLGDPGRRGLYDRLSRVVGASEEGPRGDAVSARDLRRYEGELDDEMPVAEVLSRKRAARDLLVRKTDYRLYHVSSLDRQNWFRVSVDSGCHCPDALGMAGPFGCKHWYAMEAFRNNGDMPLQAPAGARR